MEIILLSIACVANSVAIILLWVSHRRGNRRGKGMSYSDIKRAMENARKMQDYYARIRVSRMDLNDKLNDLFGNKNGKAVEN